MEASEALLGLKKVLLILLSIYNNVYEDIKEKRKVLNYLIYLARFHEINTKTVVILIQLLFFRRAM